MNENWHDLGRIDEMDRAEATRHLNSVVQRAIFHLVQTNGTDRLRQNHYTKKTKLTGKELRKARERMIRKNKKWLAEALRIAQSKRIRITINPKNNERVFRPPLPKK